MKIAFVGYMASGKSLWANCLADKLDVDCIDLDVFLETNFLHQSIAKFISEKGELAFRKLEKKALHEICMRQDDLILACGGGTPCYYNNMDLLNQFFFTVFLNPSISVLVNRLKAQQNTRPLLSHLQTDELPEFVAKHLFERRHFYAQADAQLQKDAIELDDILALISME